jgi:hypothetical protein
MMHCIERCRSNSPGRNISNNPYQQYGERWDQITDFANIRLEQYVFWLSFPRLLHKLDLLRFSAVVGVEAFENPSNA